MTTCKWCGKPLRKKYKNQKYHQGDCQIEAIKEQNRKRVEKHYKKYAKRGIQTFKQYKNSLGTGSLGANPNYNTSRESKLIKRERERLKLLG